MNKVNDICIFCGRMLDNSDEHIIPGCLNGRLHSRDLICYKCNSEKFGALIDPVVKKAFQPILFVLGFSQSAKLEAPDGKEYLYKDGKLAPIKPEFTQVTENGKTYINVSGDPKNAIKFYAKKEAELLKKGHIPLERKIEDFGDFIPPLSFSIEFNKIPEIVLLLNKIAIEFYAYNNLNLDNIKPLSKKVNDLNTTLNNIDFCNYNQEVRNFNVGEISHVINLKTNTKGDLYCYIELFNVVCACIKMCSGMTETVNHLYYQDAVTGERLQDPIEVNIPEEDRLHEVKDFGGLINSLFERSKDREFQKVSKNIHNSIIKKAKEEVNQGLLKKEDLYLTCIKRCAHATAYLSIYEFPYIIEDAKDEENPQINYLHSNLQETQFTTFCELNNHLMGLKVNFQNGDIYIFEGFEKQPFLKRNGITLIKVFCTLFCNETNRSVYIPYREFFEGIIPKTTSTK